MSFCAKFLTTFLILVAISTSKPSVGSSNNNNLGFPRSARAMCILCFIPLEKNCTFLFMSLLKLTKSSTRSISAFCLR